MRRNELSQSIAQIIEWLKPLTDDSSQFLEVRSKSGSSSHEDIFEILIGLRDEYLNFSDTTKRVIDILDLTDIVDTHSLESIASGDDDNLRQLLLTVRRHSSYLPHISQLLEDNESSNVRKDLQSEKTEVLELLEVIVLDSDEGSSSPERLVYSLEAVSAIYTVASKISGELQPLRVIGCDSGSDKSFDFTGGATAIGHVKEVILSLWDKIVFYKLRKISMNFKLISEGLEILDKVDEIDSLSPEEKEILKRQVIHGATQFLKSGSTIPEIGDRIVLDQRALLVPELLELPSEVTSAATDDEETGTVN